MDDLEVQLDPAEIPNPHLQPIEYAPGRIYDPFREELVDFVYDPETGVAGERRTYNPTAVLDANARLKADRPRNVDLKAFWHHYATIPLGLIDYWRNVEGFDALKAPLEDLIRKINDHEYCKLRTTEWKA